MRYIGKILGAIVEFSTKIGDLAIIFLVLVIFVDVVIRYVFNIASAMTFDMEWQLFSLVILLGMGGTLRAGKHVRVDLFYSKYSEKRKIIVDLIFTVIFFAPFCLVYIYFSFPYAVHSFNLGEGCPDAGGLPYWWIVKFFMPIGFAILFLQGIVDFVNKYKQLLKMNSH